MTAEIIPFPGKHKTIVPFQPMPRGMFDRSLIADGWIPSPAFAAGEPVQIADGVRRGQEGYIISLYFKGDEEHEPVYRVRVPDGAIVIYESSLRLRPGPPLPLNEKGMPE